MIITATAIDTQLLFESEPTDKQRFNKIESKLFTESDLLEIVTIEGWPSALYLCENRNILAYKVLDRLKVVIEKEKEEHRLEHVSYPETRMISVVLSIVGGENSHIDKQIGVVEINQVSTLADVRLMLKFEIDNDILPTFYSFLYKGFPCSIKQESFRRAWECLPRLHLLARHESKTSNQDANIKESESKDNNKTKKVHRRVDKSLVPTPIHSLASCSEGSSVVYLLHELNDVKEGDVIRIGHTMSRDYIVREEMEIVKPFQGFYQFPKEVEKPNEKPSESKVDPSTKPNSATTIISSDAPQLNIKNQLNRSKKLDNILKKRRINGISVLFTIKRKDMRNYTKDFSIIIYVYIPQTSQTNVYHIDELELRKYVEKDIYNIQREFPKKYIEKSKRKQPGSSVSLAELFDKQNLYHVISTRILIKQNKIPGKEVYIKFSKQALGQRGNKIFTKEALTNAKWAGWVKVINDHYVVPVALSDIISKSSNKTMTSSTTYWYNPVDGTKQLDTPDFTIEWKKRLQRSYYYRSYTGLDIYYDPLTTTYFQYHSMTETFE
eukprot:gene17553-23117_t